MAAAFRALLGGATGRFWLPALLIVVAIDLLSLWVEPLEPLKALAIFLPAAALLQALLTPFLILALLRAFDGRGDDSGVRSSPDIADFVSMFILYALSSFVVLFGLQFYILPGILIASLLFFADAVIIREHRGPIRAVEASVQLGHGHRMEIFVLALFLNGASIVSDIGFEALFADQPILYVALDAAVQTPLFLYSYLVVVMGYLGLSGGAEPPNSREIEN